jgi:hypothetical protein
MHWNAKDLLQLAARRLAIYCELTSVDSIFMLQENLNDPKQCAVLLERILGDKSIEGDGQISEPRLQFILRHTQLLPRHFLSLLNNLIDGQQLCQPCPPAIAERELRRIVTGTTTLLCAEIFRGFRERWHEAQPVCEALLPELNQIFTMQDLEKLYQPGNLKASVNRYLRQISGNMSEVTDPGPPYELDAITVRDLLSEIGAIGRVVGEERTPKGIEVLGEFVYTLPSRLRLKRTDKMCVHPIFSLQYGCPNADDALVVPQGSGLNELLGNSVVH